MATKKTTAKKSSSIEIPMTVLRDTKNTRRYEADDEDAPVTSLYISKEAKTPDNIVVVINI